MISSLIRSYVAVNVIVLSIVAVPLVAIAQVHNDEDEKASISNEGLVQLNFPDQVSLGVLIEYISDRLELNIIYDDSVATKQVTIMSPSKIPADSLRGFLQSVLKMSGYSLVKSEQPGWLKIVASREFLLVTEEVGEKTPALEGVDQTMIVTQVFRLEHVRSPEVIEIINQFLSKPGGNSFAIGDDLLVATDYAGNLRRISEVIDLMDRPVGEVAVVFIPVKHSQAEVLASRVTEILNRKHQLFTGPQPKGRGTPDISGAALVAEPRTNQLVMIVDPKREAEVMGFIQALDVPLDVKVARYYFDYIPPERVLSLVDSIYGKDFKDLYHSAFDPDSGLLLVAGPEEIHSQVISLKQELDIPKNHPNHRDIRFYKVMNTTATEILATIRLLDTNVAQAAEVYEDGKQVRADVSETPGIDSKASSLRRTNMTPGANDGMDLSSSNSTVVTIDVNTNTIIVIASPAVHEMYETLIKRLDQRRPQVMVEVTMVTLDTSNNFSLGVD